ncbi:MAG: NADP-dependent oxidoreductase [Microbacterium sp.]|uniref:quinone oxidoreductase family protein n=1 Tax=Microbacterium sp. TaxID=51671 RepID=UPI0039E41017
MAHAIVHTEFGGPEVLTLAEIPDPVPGEGEVAIRVEAAGVNPIDWKLRSGIRASAPLDRPRRVGFDGAGVVVSVGDGVDGLRPGDPVAFRDAAGSYATAVAVAASNVFVRLSGVTAAQGAALGIPAGTAYQSLRSLGVRGGDTLLVHGGSGSVGQAAIQFAALWGARVLATTSAGRAGRVRELGAEPIEYGPGLVGRVRAAAPDGVSVILDAAGADEAIEASLDLLPDRSRIATIVRGKDAPGWGIRAFSGGGASALTPQQVAWRVEAVPVALALMAVGRFSVEFGGSYRLEDAADAQRASQDGAPGKLVLEP